MDFNEILREIGTWTGDGSIERGTATVGAMLAAVYTGFRWLRPGGKKRTCVRVDAEPGEEITIMVGSGNGETQGKK